MSSEKVRRKRERRKNSYSNRYLTPHITYGRSWKPVNNNQHSLNYIQLHLTKRNREECAIISTPEIERSHPPPPPPPFPILSAGSIGTNKKPRHTPQKTPPIPYPQSHQHILAFPFNPEHILIQLGAHSATTGQCLSQTGHLSYQHILAFPSNWEHILTQLSMLSSGKATGPWQHSTASQTQRHLASKEGNTWQENGTEAVQMACGDSN